MNESESVPAVDTLLWLDLEMTGLDPATCVIIEVAAIVTDLDFRHLDTYEAVVSATDAQLNAMDEWCTTTHTESGLVDKIRSAGRPLSEIDAELAEFCRLHFGDVAIVLCGNSIGQDRKFIDAQMPRIAELLHYRMIDVSSFKEILNRKWGVTFVKKGRHRALDDITESIEELSYYLGGFEPLVDEALGEKS